MSVAASKNNIARELFVRTADDNYVAARWCAINRLNTDFLWLAVHALEKYMKAALLLNGQTCKHFSHGILDLYAATKQLGGPLPELILKPDDLDIDHWRERSAEEFIGYLSDNGNADNRYAIYGYVTSSQDLHMLDAMVFAIRRLVCPLDEPMFPGQDPGRPTITHCEVLFRQPKYHGHMNMPLDRLIESREASQLRHAALNLNLSFAPSDYRHEPLPQVSASSEAVIVRRILDPLASDDGRRAAEGVEIAQWFLEAVRVPKDVADQIRGAIKAAGVVRASH